MGSNPTVLQLPVDPVPASRPRVTRRGFSYYAEPYKSYKSELKKAFQERWTEDPIETPVGVSITIFKAPPKKSKLTAPKPDVDNYAKAVLDAMNGVVLVDDSLVYKLRVEKLWAAEAEPGRVVVVIDRI